MDVARQGGQLPDTVDVVLTVQDRLVKMRDAPPMRDVVPERGAQLLSGRAGVGVAPGAEGRQQFAVRVDGQVAVHHRRDAKSAQ